MKCTVLYIFWEPFLLCISMLKPSCQMLMVFKWNQCQSFFFKVPLQGPKITGAWNTIYFPRALLSMYILAENQLPSAHGLWIKSTSKFSWKSPCGGQKSMKHEIVYIFWKPFPTSMSMPKISHLILVVFEPPYWCKVFVEPLTTLHYCIQAITKVME